MKESVKEIPQGYKDSPLGIIPQDWELKRLGEIGKFEKGFGVPKDKILSDGLPCVTYGELYTKYNVEFNDTYSHISRETSVYSKSVNGGCILFAGSGETPEDIGKCAAYCGFDKCYVGGDIIIFIPNGSFNNVFLSYVLNSNIGGRQRYKMAQGHSVVHIYSHNLNDIQIMYPTLKIQQKIVELLRIWDFAIEKQTLKIQKLELRKKGLMQQLLTGKKRLPGFTEPWQTVRLGDVVDYEQPTNYIVTSDNYRDEYKTPVLTAGKTFVLGYTNELNGIYDKLPVIIFDDFTTDIKYVDFPFKVKSSAMKILTAKENKDILFIYEAMKQIKYLVGGHERQWISKYSQLTIKIPSVDEQIKISEIIANMNRDIFIEKNKLSKLQLEKKGLMQQLLTGKIIIN